MIFSLEKSHRLYVFWTPGKLRVWLRIICIKQKKSNPVLCFLLFTLLEQLNLNFQRNWTFRLFALLKYGTLIMILMSPSRTVLPESLIENMVKFSL